MGVRLPEYSWALSARCYRNGHRFSARFLKLLNYFLFRAILPYECEVEEDVRFLHRGLNVVIHPRTCIGRGVVIAHGVTLAAADDEESRVCLEDNVFVGAHAIVAAGRGRRVRVGAGATLGAGVVVTSDVAARSRVRAAEPIVKTNSA